MFVWMSRFVTLVSPGGGMKVCKIGFSWTTLFLWWFVPLFRGDWLGFIVYLLLFHFTKGTSALLFPFFYNRLYIMGLLHKGWSPASYSDWETLRDSRFSVPDWQGREDGFRQAGESFRQAGESFRPTDDGYERSFGERERGGSESGENEAWEAGDWKSERERAVDVEWRDDADRHGGDADRRGGKEE